MTKIIHSTMHSTIVLEPVVKNKKRKKITTNCNKKFKEYSSDSSSEEEEINITSFAREWYPEFSLDNQSGTDINKQNGLCKSSPSTRDNSPNRLENSGDSSFNHLDTSTDIGPNHLEISDDDCIIVEENITRKQPILEHVTGYYLNPLYSGSEPNSDDNLSTVSSVIYIPKKSSNSSRSSATDDFDFKYTDLDAFRSVKLNQDVRINISKCNLKNIQETWNWKKLKPCKIQLNLNEFKTTTIKISPPTSIPSSPRKEDSISKTTLDNVKDFELFDEKGYFQPVNQIEDRDDIFIKFSLCDKPYQKVGPIDSYTKTYDRIKCTVRSYCLNSSCGTSVTVQKSDFSKKYQNFLNEHVKINSKPCVITKVNLPKSGGYVHKNHLSKKDKNYGMPKSKKMDLIPLAKVMKQLGVSEEIDVSLLTKMSPSLYQFRNNEEIIKRIATFIKFCHERMKRWELKRMQLEDDGRDEIFVYKKFTNLARELDRGTQYLREDLLESLLTIKGKEELLSIVLFKCCAYRLMNKVETFKQFGRIPGPGEFKEFCTLAKAILDQGDTVFTGVHQNMGFDRYTDTVNFIKDNLTELVKDLLSASGTEQAFEVIKAIKNFGNFFAWQVVCDLTEVNLIRCTEDWACLGPGAVKGLQFALKNYMRPQQGTKFLAKVLQEADQAWLELNIPPGIKIDAKLVEHALCEFNKYCRFADQGVPPRKFKSRSFLDKDRKCLVCLKQSKLDSGKYLFCIFCNRPAHLSCLNKSNKDPKPDVLNFSCKDCRFINDRTFPS